MSYKTLPLSEVMSHEFGLIEGNFHNLAEADIASAIPAHLTFEQLKQHLHEGKLVLVSDKPQTPALLSYNDPIGPKTWRLNSEVISAFSDDATKELLAKTTPPEQREGTVYVLETPQHLSELIRHSQSQPRRKRN